MENHKVKPGFTGRTVAPVLTVFPESILPDIALKQTPSLSQPPIYNESICSVIM